MEKGRQDEEAFGMVEKGMKLKVLLNGRERKTAESVMEWWSNEDRGRCWRKMENGKRGNILLNSGERKTGENTVEWWRKEDREKCCRMV